MNRMRNTIATGTLLALAAGSVVACSGNQAEPGTAAAKTVARGSHCGGSRDEPQLEVATNEDAYMALLDKGARTNRDAPTPDFEQEIAVYMGMGQKPTGGYGLALRDEPVTIRDSTATIPVAWRTPASDAVVTQALTSPCLVVTLPKGDYRQVRAVDADGKERLRAPIE